MAEGAISPESRARVYTRVRVDVLRVGKIDQDRPDVLVAGKWQQILAAGRRKDRVALHADRLALRFYQSRLDGKAYIDRARGVDEPQNQPFPARGTLHSRAQPASSGNRASKKGPAPAKIVSAIETAKPTPDFSQRAPDLPRSCPSTPRGIRLQDKGELKICGACPSKISTPCRIGMSGCFECWAEIRGSPCPDRSPERAGCGCRG